MPFFALIIKYQLYDIFNQLNFSHTLVFSIFDTSILVLKKPMRRKITLLLLVIASSLNCFSQTKKDTTQISNKTITEIRGLVLDHQNQLPLPYTNIIVKSQNRGVITNEKGDFLLNISNLKETDSIWFQYIGFATKKLSINQLQKNSTVFLKQDVYAMNEVLITNKLTDPKKIIKKVLENKDINYVTSTHKNQAFIRDRYITDIKKFHIEFDKSTIEGLDQEMIKSFEESIPKHSTSYSDFLGYLYADKNEKDELDLKVDPIKMVQLKEEDIAELDKIEKLFDSLFKSTGEKEYWKIKSGIFGSKIDVTEDIEKDTLNEKDTQKLSYLNSGIKYKLRYTSFENKKQWEFLYKTNNYNYTIEGLTNVNGEDVYIIDFSPKSDGKYEGRLYISVVTSALIRADYQYAPTKIGKDIHLLGIGFTETEFKASIYFEKTNDTYELKYFSTKYTTEVSLNRKFALQKKQNKLIFDKKLNEIKARFNMIAKNETNTEYMVIENQKISKSDFDNFKEKERLKVIYVDLFDENLWKDYDIIEPTQQMRTYKKTNF